VLRRLATVAGDGTGGPMALGLALVLFLLFVERRAFAGLVRTPR
jgi:hypothetical protein